MATIPFHLQIVDYSSNCVHLTSELIISGWDKDDLITCAIKKNNRRSFVGELKKQRKKGVKGYEAE